MRIAQEITLARRNRRASRSRIRLYVAGAAHRDSGSNDSADRQPRDLPSGQRAKAPGRGIAAQSGRSPDGIVCRSRLHLERQSGEKAPITRPAGAAATLRTSWMAETATLMVIKGRGLTGTCAPNVFDDMSQKLATYFGS